jgi:hypothetical protein
MNLELLQNLIQNPDIEVISLSEPHQKASELYVEVYFRDSKINLYGLDWYLIFIVEQGFLLKMKTI